MKKLERAQEALNQASQEKLNTLVEHMDHMDSIAISVSSDEEPHLAFMWGHRMDSKEVPVEGIAQFTDSGDVLHTLFITNEKEFLSEF